MDDRKDRRRPAARFTLGAALAALMLAAGAADAPAAPDFALRAAGGTNHRLSEHRGEVVALVFWASWCGDCRRELERFERLRRTYGNVGLVVYGVNIDKERAIAGAISGAADIGYPVLIDAGREVSRLYRADRLPLIVLIDRNGIVRARYDALDEREERGLMVGLRDLIDE
jgi:peroxiredoxin